MRSTVSGLLALPSALFAIIFATPSYGQDWPYNLPLGTKYYPEHEYHIKRDFRIQQKLNLAAPSGVRKMSEHEGEKFFLDYWQFDEQTFDFIEMDKPLNARRSVSSAALLSNISNVEELLPPLLLHAESQQFVPSHRFFGRGLSERAYQCPTGTNSCALVGYPNSCCATGETCMSLPENNGATIGCCPDGASCGGQVGSCDTAAGYTNCENENGGCCIPGYTCQGAGCKLARLILKFEILTDVASRRICIDRYNHYYITNSYRDHWSFMVNVIRQHNYSNLCYSSKFWLTNSFDLHYYDHFGGYNFWKRLDNDSRSNDDHPSILGCVNDLVGLWDTD
jgi:hypothetical protein